ncbi:hypothetical protein [Kurthia huakuii]|uniref:hypothetical protein n=1 Tax=Kurthia huakuii TaxID=1421019 RepID=UPI00049831D4|nr:hypothetical protein [Kurthia huakuii]MBM7699119.1 putative transcriptional regulator [Kurthia huakuii]
MAKMKYTFGFLLCNFLLMAPISLATTTQAQASTYKTKSTTTTSLEHFTKKGTLPNTKGSINMTYKTLKKKVPGYSGITEGNFIVYQAKDGATYIFKPNGNKSTPNASAKVQAINKVYFKEAYTKQDMQNLYGDPLDNLYKTSKYYVGFSSYYGNTTLSVGNFKTMQTIADISNY